MSRRILLAVGLAAAGHGASAEPIVDSASAVAAAKKYTKAQCTAETPCTFKPKREGKRWNVWVEFTKRNSPRGKPYPYPGGHVILYFDAEGHLVKRVDGE